jgi:hypothetical protein
MVTISIGILVFGAIGAALLAILGFDPGENVMLIGFFAIGGGFALLEFSKRPSQ